MNEQGLRREAIRRAVAPPVPGDLPGQFVELLLQNEIVGSLPGQAVPDATSGALGTLRSASLSGFGHRGSGALPPLTKGGSAGGNGELGVSDPYVCSQGRAAAATDSALAWTDYCLEYECYSVSNCARCLSHQFDSPQEKANWCNNDVCERPL